MADSARQEAERLRAKPCFTPELLREAQIAADQAQEAADRLERELQSTRRGSRAQLAAGWH